MKHLVMAALLMTGVATFAQTAAKTEGTELTRPKKEKATPESQTKKLTEELGLDAKQQAKVKELFEQQAKAKEALKEQRKAAVDDTAKAEIKAKAKEDKEAFKAKMKTILTEEQYTKWSTFKTNKPSSMNDKGQPVLKGKSGISRNVQPAAAPKN
jgi:periplasmic protein CpxP/Spy